MSVHSISVVKEAQNNSYGYRADCTCGWDGPSHHGHGPFAGPRHGGDPYQQAAADAFAHLNQTRDGA